MLFNSFIFGLFLPIVFFIYWFIFYKKINQQNIFILLASYLFYGWWDWRFLILIVFSSITDFYLGLAIFKAKSEKTRKLFLFASLLLNLGLLATFKYLNFFISSFVDLLSLFNYKADYFYLNIILPVGISYYTFQTLSYSIDIYRKNIKPTNNLISFLAFVSFFPQLVAGPIERAANLLPQFNKKRKFEYDKAADGMRQILWGLFKKIVIADNCAVYVSQVFDNYSGFNSITLLIAPCLFFIQVYCDFSGYSDIAIGTARLFGFNLLKNFDFPLFSRNIIEFWKKWQISLMSWLRDYLYLPLVGNSNGKGKIYLSMFLVFVLSGLWHGASWNFIIWGALNGLLAIFTRFLGKPTKNQWYFKMFGIVSTFFIYSMTLIPFRTNSFHDFINYSRNVLQNLNNGSNLNFSIWFILVLIFFFMVEWFQKDKNHALEINTHNTSKIVRWGIYLVIVVLINVLYSKQQEFIYFQF